MKTREEVARHIENWLKHGDVSTEREKAGKYHIGWQELRDLLDFIYEGPPDNNEQELINTNEYRKF